MRFLRRTVVLLVLIGVVVAGRRLAVDRAGAAFAGRIDRPFWTESGPPVLVDDAHWNFGTVGGRMAAFAALAAADGYRVLPGANGARAETLIDAKLSVIVNPLGVMGVLRRGASAVGLGDLAVVDDDGLITQEIETTLQWVENGGSLLLAADETPFARGSISLAARLGVRMRGQVVVDVGHSESRNPAWLVFSRENGLIGVHPIVDGWPDAPPVNRVVTFGGQALEPPVGGATLLQLSPSASEVARAGDPPTAGQPVGGLALGVAFDRGRGRVVVLGDSHVLTADVEPGGAPTGLDWANTNNARFVRYVLRWLSRRDDRPSRAADR